MAFTEVDYSPVVANQGTQVSLLVKEQGKEFACSIVALQMNTALKIYDSLADPTAIAYTASLIVDEFKLLKVEEIILAFKRGAALRYGKIFGKLTLPVFFEWIRGYISEVNGEYGELAKARETQHANRKYESMLPEDALLKLTNGIDTQESRKETMGRITLRDKIEQWRQQAEQERIEKEKHKKKITNQPK